MRVLGRDPLVLAKDTWREMSEDKISVYAAQMAYAFFFALFPLLLFFAALLNLVADKQTVMGWLGGRIMSTLPGGVADMLRLTVEKVIFAKGAPGILSFGLLTAAWSGSSIFGSFRQALNAAYEVEETRPWWKQYLLQLGALVVSGIVLLVATVILLNGDGIMRWVGGHFGLGQVTTLVWSIVQFPIAIAAVVALLWMLYLYLPNCSHQNRTYVVAGAVVATVLWIAATLLFRIYVQKFNALNPAYGAIGAIMVLLTWMYYSSYVLLAAGELNSELQGGSGKEGRGTREETGKAEKGKGRQERAVGRRDGRQHVAAAMARRDGESERPRALPAGDGRGIAAGAGTPASDGHRGFGALLKQLASDGALVVRRELALARLELATIARDIGVGTMLIATGAALALLGVLATLTGIILLIGDQWLPSDLYWVAALIVTVIAGIAAVAFSRHGRALAAPQALAPNETIDTLKEDVQWTRDQLTSSGRSS